MTGREVSIVVPAGLGVVLMLISAYGMVRMRGVHQRMQAASVGASLGISLLMLSAGISYAGEAQFWRMVALVALFFVTSPIASTAIARAAYRRRRSQAQSLFVLDEMAGPAYKPDFEMHDSVKSESARATAQPPAM